MKQTSQLQQLHLLLSSGQSEPADSNGYGMKEASNTSGSLDLYDSSSSGVSSERGDVPNSGRHPCRSHSDSATSRDLSPDRSDAYLCSSSGCSVRSNSLPVSSPHCVSPKYISLRSSCPLACTPTQPSDAYDDSVDFSRAANFLTYDPSNLKTFVIDSRSFLNNQQQNEQIQENASTHCIRQPSASNHDFGADWAMNGFLNDISGDVATADPWESQTIRDLQDCSSETSGAFEESTPRQDILCSQSVLSQNKRQRQIEIEQVHQVYKQIAPHCDRVRQKAWPRVRQFLKDLAPGSLVADVGCGNGRYLMINPSTFKIGCDLCPPFLDQAKSQGHEVMIADNLALPFRDGIFDAVISIGVIHHFASLERRIMAISELSRVLSPGGKLMVYVWAFEQAHRKFEGQDVLIPWVKPEVKGSAPRKSASLSSEPDNDRYRSRSSSCGGKHIDRPTCGRRQRPEYRLISDGEKHRSKSLGDESTARDVYRSFSIASGHCGGQTIVEVDNGAVKQDNHKLQNTTSSKKSNYDSVNGEDGEDLKVSKWPGQLVSECKKLGKFLRSLSSKSISLDDGQADQQDVGENIPDVHNKDTPLCNTDLQNGVNTNDTYHVSRSTPLVHQKYHTEDTSSMSVKQLQQYKQPQGDCNSFHGPDLKMQSSCAVGCSDVKALPFVSSGSCQGYFNNATVTTASDAIAYHDILSSSAASEFRSDSDGAVYNQFPSTSSGLKYSLDSELVSGMINKKNAKPFSSRETSCSFSQAVKVIESRVNEHVNAQSTLIRNNCSDEIKADIFKNHTHPLCDNDIEAPSESWTTVSMSESFNSEDLVSSYSDTTILESQFSSNTNIPDHRSENPQELPSTQEASIRCEDAPKTPLSNLIDTAARVPMGIISVSGNVHDLNKCLPKCHNKFHNVESQSSYPDQQRLVETTRNSGPSRDGTTTTGVDGFSDVSDYTDHLSSCSALPLDARTLIDSPVQHNILEATSESHLTKSSGSSLDNRRRDKGNMEITIDKTNEYVFDNEKMVLQATKRMTINDERRNLSDSATSQEAVPSRGTLKTFISKLANYFRPHLKTGSIKFTHYHNGNSAGRKLPFESESSDMESSVSSFSTHSSCYPGLFAMSKERDNCEQVDYISEVDPHKYYSYDDDFEIINDSDKQVDDNRANTEIEADILKLNINILNDKHNFRQDFVNDVSMAVAEHTTDTTKNVDDNPYVFKVENISQVPLRKSSFLNNLSQKWSGMFGKRSRGGSRRACLHYSTASASSSSDGNEERLKISLTDTEVSSVSKYPPHKRPLVRRPNSLDFTKKRTRRGGERRPAPQKEKQNSRDLERVRQFQEKVQLSLSDAMTLLGDGVAEESIIKRLDMPARTIFAEMKRINFAMRKFPMSSLGNSSSSKEDIPKEAASAEKVPDEVTNTRHLTMKMLRHKKLLPTNRGFSESIGAQDVTKSRRQHFMENKEAPGIELTNLPCLDKKCISEDFGISFDMLGGQIHKSKCQLLYSCNSDSREDLSSLLESSAERQQGPRGFRNRTNNAQVSPEDLISFDTFEDVQQGCTAITHRANDLLDRDFADTKSISLSKYDARTKEHRAGVLGLQSNNTSWEFSQEGNSFDEASESTNILNKDSCSKMGNDVKLTYPNASSGKKLPLKAIDFILKPRQTRRTNKHRIPDNEQLTESKTDNSLSRYYHVFKKGELDQLVTHYVPSLRVVDTFYDHANWCVIAEKLTVP